MLLERLKAALQQRLPLLSQADQAARATDDLKGFSPTARWRLIQPIAHMVEEPQNVVPLHAPSVPEEDAAFGPPKHDFAETFDHAPFVGIAKFPKLHRNGRPVVVDGKQQWEEKVSVKGGPKMEFLLDNGLDENSTPQEWFKAFLPIYNGRTNNPTHSKTQYWTNRWANYRNLKAVLLGAGVPGGIYLSFTPFSYQEMEQFVGLYILQGLNPSPHVDMKLSSQNEDPIQGNDLRYHMFGSNAVLQHKQFKAFFSVQDPSTAMPE